MNRLHPLVKLYVTIFYIVLLMTLPGEKIPAIILMTIYWMTLFLLGDLSFFEAMKRVKIVIPFLALMGVLQLFFDRRLIVMWGNIPISHGMLVFFTLLVKGLWFVLAVYLLTVTTSMEDICYALQLLHVPAMLVTVILLIYRYIFLMLEEVGRMSTAYHLRAPGQKGIKISAWGSFVGNFLIRSIDRAQDVYESMCLRGFKGHFSSSRQYKLRVTDGVYALVWTTAFVAVICYSRLMG